MRLLLLSDEEDKSLWDFYQPERLAGIDMILSAGDLKAEYLSFLVTMANRPLLYVRGNHDGDYVRRPPEGCECVEDRIAVVNGLRILGLGGCLRYNQGASCQYTEREMQRRIRHLWLALHRHGGIDILLTHAPARGLGDAEDLAHRGFAAFLPLLDRWKPRYLIHGHVHKRYGVNLPRTLQYGDTTIINAAVGRYVLDIADPGQIP